MKWDDGLAWYLDLVTAPADLAVELGYVRDNHLRVTTDQEEDTRIQRAIVTATAQAERFTARAIVPQTWALILSGFPASGTVELPLPPLIEVSSITYQDIDDAQQTLGTGVYSVVRQDGPHARRSWIDLVTGQSWPGTYARRDAVTVNFRAGYLETVGASPEVTKIPDGIQEGIAMRAAEYYKQRSDSVLGVGVTVGPALMGSRQLWHEFKVY